MKILKKIFPLFILTIWGIFFILTNSQAAEQRCCTINYGMDEYGNPIQPYCQQTDQSCSALCDELAVNNPDVAPRCTETICGTDACSNIKPPEKPAETTPLKPLKLKLNIAIPGLAEFSQGEGVEINNETLAKYIGGIYKFFVGIAGILAVFMIVIGGVQWLFSGGNASKITSAKETIIGAIVGLLLAVGSYTILYTINPKLVKFPGVGVMVIQPYIEDTGLDCQNVKNSAEGCNVTAVETVNITSAGHVILSLQQPATSYFNGLMAAWYQDNQNNPNHKKIKITSMFRSYDYQNCLNQNDEKDLANAPGKSEHEKGRAFDINIKGNNDLNSTEYSAFLVYANTHKFKAANSNYGQDESWHFTFQEGVSDLCAICPKSKACSK